MPTNNPLPQATSWQSNAEAREGFDLRVPSGQLCRVKHMDLQDMIIDGIIDDVDVVLRIINSDVMKKSTAKRTKAQSVEDGLKFMGSTDGQDAMRLMDKIVPYVVISPEVQPNPPKGEDFQKGLIYVRDIDVNDRAFIFSQVMKSVDNVAEFRPESK